MHRTRFEVRTVDGEFLDEGDFINCPDLADDRIARCRKYHPDAVVVRTEDPEFSGDRTKDQPLFERRQPAAPASPEGIKPMSDLQLSFEGGSERNVASDRQRIVKLYRTLRDFKGSVTIQGDAFARYLGLVDNYVTQGEGSQSSTNESEIDFNKAVSELAAGLDQAVTALKAMNAVARKVEVHVDEYEAQFRAVRKS